MYIAFPEYIRSSITDVSPSYWRLQASIIKFGNRSSLLINSYFPTDPRSPNADQADLLETLSNIRDIIRKNESDSILWAGDINADFIRNTVHTSTVSDFVEELGLTRAWDRFFADFTCCHDILGVSHVSTLDHFFWSHQLEDYILDAGVLHFPDNKSDHSPIFCVVSFPTVTTEFSEARMSQPKPSWSRASSVDKVRYKTLLETRINTLAIPNSTVSCKDVHCQDPEHIAELDNFTMDLLETIQDVAEQSLPLPGTGGHGRLDSQRQRSVPGWRESVRPFREEAYFWHQLWVSCGRPLNCEVHSNMKKSRNKYHYEYKKCCKAEMKIKSSKLLDSCLNGEADLFKQIKAMRRSKPVVATSMDGVKSDITGHFKTKYEELYNSSDDKHDLLRVQEETEGKVDDKSILDAEKVTPELVKQAVHKLMPGKSDPVFSYSSDCLKNAPELLFQQLSLVIQSFLVHGHVTSVLLLATLVPIIKDKLGSISSSKNYRSIAISSLILKLIDWIFLMLFGVKFCLSDLQFAYQAGCSTTMCTWAVLETIDWYHRNGSEVFTCAMDMTKAFDLTLHSLLFMKMIKADFPVIFIRLFIFIYINQVANVRWNGDLSSVFPMTNGVRQGAVLSAIAYCFYCEDLFTLLQQRRSGCWVLGRYHGIVGYSDDNWLLAPSLNALQDMLITCEEYAKSHNLKFSTDENPEKCKTKLIAFLKKQRELPSLRLCGTELPWVDKVKHLGNTISNTMDGNQLDIRVKTAKFVDKSNTICQEFHFAHPKVKSRVNRIYNGHYTGSELWKMGSKEYDKVLSTYNRSVKIMFNLPWATHRSFIEPLTGVQHVSRLLVKKYVSFIEKIKHSEKKSLKLLFNLAKNDVRTITGHNLRSIMLLVGKNTIEDIHNIVDFDYKKLDEQEKWKVNIIEELIDIRAGAIEVPGLEVEEMEDILHFISTS